MDNLILQSASAAEGVSSEEATVCLNFLLVSLNDMLRPRKYFLNALAMVERHCCCDYKDLRLEIMVRQSQRITAKTVKRECTKALFDFFTVPP